MLINLDGKILKGSEICKFPAVKHEGGIGGANGLLALMADIEASIRASITELF